MQDDITAVYDELRALAALHLRRGVRSPSLQATQLVHEAWLRLACKSDWHSKTHFMAAASRTMRNVLIDAARARHATKRGGGKAALEITPGIELQLSGLALPLEQLLELDQALNRLAEEDPRKARVVEMRFFGGMEFPEIAEALEVALVTVKRDWQFSRAWLAGQLSEPANPDGTPKF
ncbi:MAG: sigma-70 family RNA polymerase sigma factor [Acidobacteria bacterium]|nr:sigma-70 family RNA polymerase sigma factor [Acidobacteriota bacterium]